ncbi:AAEL017422-PA [Aedes aegypti]|uniref:AAEL017422-PA n=1 Tax=Aedes aegypti TaxID=7159 RepID=J9HHL2_AEDAE|nr:AAEL017422-PA [Aedes aegypti]
MAPVCHLDFFWPGRLVLSGDQKAPLERIRVPLNRIKFLRQDCVRSGGTLWSPCAEGNGDFLVWKQPWGYEEDSDVPFARLARLASVIHDLPTEDRPITPEDCDRH